jgi:hypothetical protein
MGSVVGAGLLANGVGLVLRGRLNKCLRQQAGSYGIGMGRRLCIQPSSHPAIQQTFLALAPLVEFSALKLRGFS